MKIVSSFVKLLACIMAGISCAFCLMRVGHRFLAEWLPMPVLWIIAACLFLIALGNGVYWAFAKRSGQTDA